MTVRIEFDHSSIPDHLKCTCINGRVMAGREGTHVACSSQFEGQIKCGKSYGQFAVNQTVNWWLPQHFKC